MRLRFLAVVLLALTGCGDASSTAPDPLPSACHEQSFEQASFTVCDPGRGALQLVAAGPRQPALRSFVELEQRLGRRASTVAFAMNAGMYDEEGRPIGLAVVDGRQVHAINRRAGGGNFHLMPNGVFLIDRNGRAAVLPTKVYRDSVKPRLATQSGPMLVIDGKLHPAFEANGTSRLIRNGVGITPDGRPRFVIAEQPVSFGKFARFFRDGLHARDALFLDGSVSALWDPAVGRRDNGRPLGPMIIAFKPAPQGK